MATWLYSGKQKPKNLVCGFAGETSASMSIQSLSFNISDNNRRIAQLEQECDELTKTIDNLYLEGEEFAYLKGRFEQYISYEHDRVSSMRSIKNMRIAQKCGEKLTTTLNSEKSLLANEAFTKIGEVINSHIYESEESRRKKREEIRRLEEENSFFKQSIYRMQEEERRYEVRRNALL